MAIGNSAGYLTAPALESYATTSREIGLLGIQVVNGLMLVREKELIDLSEDGMGVWSDHVGVN